MKAFALAVSALLLWASCNKPAAGGRYATIELRDGTSISGTVLAISASEIQIADDAKVTLTNAMADVFSIEYDDPPPASAPNAAAATPGQAHAAPRELRPHQHVHPQATAITTKTHELSVGTEILVRNDGTIDSDKVVEGQDFPGEITKDVLDASGGVVIPAGANAEILIRSVSRGGKIRGAPDLVLDLASVSIDGRQYKLGTSDLAEKGRNGIGADRRPGEFPVGTVIGAIIGGGRGPEISAAPGGSASALTRIQMKGTIKVPVESVLIFKLDKPLRVSAAK